jgi:hypothetical protein
MFSPNPVSSPRSSSLQDVRRRVLCSNYDQCLNRTISENWKGFSCDPCEAFNQTDWSKSKWIDDAQRCVGLLAAVFLPTGEP